MTPQHVDDFDAVETAADFVAYLRLLSADYARDVEEHRGQPFPEGNWAHWDLGAFLEAWAAWLEAATAEEPSWWSFARQLHAARSYE